jgi:transcriptional regulator with XRE-family HTH domain
MNIGSKIKDLRMKMKMSQNDFAKASGISVSYLSEIERGLKKPTFEIVFRISEAFNINISQLIGETPGTPLTPELKEIVETLNSFKPNQIKLLNDFLDSIK